VKVGSNRVQVQWYDHSSQFGNETYLECLATKLLAQRLVLRADHPMMLMSVNPGHQLLTFVEYVPGFRVPQVLALFELLLMARMPSLVQVAQEVHLVHPPETFSLYLFAHQPLALSANCLVDNLCGLISSVPE